MIEGMRIDPHARFGTRECPGCAVEVAANENRCPICGRPRAYMRKFGLCRICFRNMSLRGELPGVRKSSW